MKAAAPKTPGQPPPERAMGDEELDLWLEARSSLKPLSRNASMMEGFVAAVVAGPVSLDPPQWICPLLAIRREAFDTGGTPEFAAIKAVADRHNAVSDQLCDAVLTPHYRKGADGLPDATDWCEGFMAAVGLASRRWNDVLDPEDRHHRLIVPILIHCAEPKKWLRNPRSNVDYLARSSRRKARREIPRVVASMREHFHLHRFGKPHPNTIMRAAAEHQR